MVILDPPKFTRTRRSLEDALRAYHRINRLGASLLPPGGTLVTCSCSGNVTREDFLTCWPAFRNNSAARFRSSNNAARPPDHPTIATCLETEYLKCFICRVL